jgi:hypothetical protein
MRCLLHGQTDMQVGQHVKCQELHGIHVLPDGVNALPYGTSNEVNSGVLFHKKTKIKKIKIYIFIFFLLQMSLFYHFFEIVKTEKISTKFPHKKEIILKFL